MAGSDRGDPRTPGDRRMYLYLDYSKKGALYWYVKVARKGRRINLSEGYGTSAFDVAYEAAVAALGGVLRMRRVQADVMPDQAGASLPLCGPQPARTAALLRAAPQGSAEDQDPR